MWDFHGAHGSSGTSEKTSVVQVSFRTQSTGFPEENVVADGVFGGVYLRELVSEVERSWVLGITGT